MSKILDEDEMSQLKPGIVLSKDEFRTAIHYMYGGDHNLMQELMTSSHEALREQLALAVDGLKFYAKQPKHNNHWHNETHLGDCRGCQFEEYTEKIAKEILKKLGVE